MSWALPLVATLLLLFKSNFVSSALNGPRLGFSQQPSSGLVDSVDYRILCTAYGEQPITHTWYRDEQLLVLHSHVSDQGSLTLKRASRDRDEGRYRCLVSNEDGALLSRAAVISFPYLNDFLIKDSTEVAETGVRKILRCNAPDSYPDRSITWLKKSATGYNTPLDLSVNTHFSQSLAGDLYFAYTAKQDYGVYYCEVKNKKLHRVIETSVNLKIKPSDRERVVAPAVWKFSDEMAIKNENFVMECISFGSPVPKMRFRRRRTGAQLAGSRQQGNSLRHEFKNFEVQHAGDYICEVSNEYGDEDSKSATIEMQSAPEMLTHDQYYTTALNTSLSFACNATGTPAVRYVWYFNGKRISHSTLGVTTNRGHLWLSDISKNHQGFYQCMASNIHGEASMKIYLSIIEQPAGFGAQSVSPAETTYVIVGSTATLKCKPTGSPKPTIAWRRHNTTSDIVNSDKYEVLSDGTLTINNVATSDRGVYQCTAKNRLGAETRSGRLEVSETIVITKPLAPSNEVVVGQPIVLTCAITKKDDMEVLYEWRRQRSVIRAKRDNNTKIEKTKNKSTLTILNSKPHDTAEYKCTVAWSRTESVSASIFIAVKGPSHASIVPINKESPGANKGDQSGDSTNNQSKEGPPGKPIYVEAEKLNGTFVRVTWIAGRSDDGKIFRTHVQTRTLFDPRAKWQRAKLSNNSKSDVIELSPWVQYKIRVISENKYGLSVPSDEISNTIETARSPPTKYPTKLTGTGTAPNELVISFQPLEKIDHNGPNIEYVVFYRKAHSSLKMTEAVVSDVADGQDYPSLKIPQEGTVVDDSDFYTLYEFQVQARNSEGDGPISPLTEAFTGEKLPTIAPEHLAVEITQDLKAKATWKEVPKDRLSMRGQFQGYRFVYWRENEMSEYVDVIANNAVVSLSPNTVYSFKVLAYNNKGDGPASKVVTKSTPESTPSEPANFRIKGACVSSATLTWEAPLTPNGLLTHYAFTWYMLPRGSTTRVHTEMVHVNDLAKTVRNLEPRSEYHFEIAAVTAAGTGAANKIRFDFSKLPKTKPSKPNIVSVGNSVVALTWNSVQELKITGYKIFYWEQGRPGELKAVATVGKENVIRTTIHPLEQGTVYKFQVAVENFYGTGPRSEVVSARTKGERIVVEPVDPVVPVDPNAVPTKQNHAAVNAYISALFVVLMAVLAVFVPR